MRGTSAAAFGLVLVCTVQLCRCDVASKELGVLEAEAATCEQVRTLPEGADRCAFAKAKCQSGEVHEKQRNGFSAAERPMIWQCGNDETCCVDSLLNYLQIFYCKAQPAGRSAEFVFQLFCGCLLVFIFRLLGSTAEDYFSPILTQISQDLGLPPRFAGVTLLALGNGAPDLVASVAFISAGKYQVALSGLLGGGMFVAAAVAGSVIFSAGGVKARGALLRDVSFYMAAIVVVAIIFRAGEMTWPAAVALLAMYLLFVFVVLAADVAHIWRSRVRGEEPHEKPSDQQPLLAGDIAQPPEVDLPDAEQCLGSAHSIELTSGQPSGLGSDAVDRVSWTNSHSGGRESSWSAEGAHLTYNEKVHMSGQAYRQMALAELAHSSTFFGGHAMEDARRQAVQHDHTEPRTAGPGYRPPQPCLPEESGPDGRDVEEAQGGPEARDPDRETPAVPDDRQARVQQWCAEGHGQGLPRGREPTSTSGRHAESEVEDWPQGGTRSGLAPAWTALRAIYNSLEMVFRVAEYPFTLLRKSSIPLIDSDSYDRSWLIASAVGTPLAVLWYCGWLTWLSAAIAVPISGLAALAVARWSDSSKAPEWACGLPFPVGAVVVAALGFGVAAMWIDTIASELVALLDYFGVLSGISHEVLGLTVLAWGNSVGDFSTNTAMARRGLSNMAMTACFAGPIFNLLMALSLGFMRFFAAHDVASVPVALLAVDVPSVVLILVNGALIMTTGLFYKGWVPGWYGTVPLVLYALYLCVSLAVAFGFLPEAITAKRPAVPITQMIATFNQNSQAALYRLVKM